MLTNDQIVMKINDIRAIYTEAGDELQGQLLDAGNGSFSKLELTQLIKQDNDVAELYFCDDQDLFEQVRGIQEAIIQFYGE